LGEGLIVLSLIILSTVLLLSLNVFAWPLGETLRQQVNIVPPAVERGNLTVVLGVQYNTIPSAAPQGQYPNESAASDVRIIVSTQGIQSVVDTSATNSSGVFSTALPPSTYRVEVADPRFNNLTLNLQVIGGETTMLRAVLNETNYPASAFDLMDSDSANYVGVWNEVFARVQTNQTIPTGYGVTTYVRFFTSYWGLFTISGIGPVYNGTFGVTVNSVLTGSIPFSNNTVEASIVSASEGSDSQWLQLNLSQFFSVEGVTDLEIITHTVSYTVSTSAN
jgi:hypothetical protein